MPNISEKVVVLSELTDGISVVLSELTDNVDNINNELNNLNYYANYNKEYYEKQPLTFKSSGANAQVKFTKSSGATGTLYYSYDNANWDTYTDGTFININNKIHFRGNLINDYGNRYGIGKFELSANTVVECNIMSLIYNDNFINQTTIPYEYIFYELFYNCTSLINASDLILSATTLADWCYYKMFSNCTSLTEAPELPAITLVNRCYFWMFSNCTSLLKAPELSVTILDECCYAYMFNGCTSLTKAPELPATTLANQCYYGMFSGCISLTKAPELPATILANECYSFMFQNCTSLIELPKLSATTLTNYCYGFMFQNCTSLLEAPELPATTLTDDCYCSMFGGCTSLIIAPKLPATTLADSCYETMFTDCTSLTKAPELPATTLAEHCYEEMFYGCTKLSYIKALFTTTPNNTYTQIWVSGVAATGLFIKSDDAEWNVVGTNGVPTGWTVLTESNGPTNIDYHLQYLTIEAITPGTVTIRYDGTGSAKTVSYSTDNGTTWTSITTTSSEVSLKTLAIGEKILFKGNNTSYSWGLIFGGTAQTKVYGNIMSLLYGDNFVGQITLDSAGNNFTSLFCNYTNLISAENLVLPATTLANYCYYNMFSSCTSLKEAPELPATILVNSCYYYMFFSCTSLTKAPKLPAITLSDYCYYGMFTGCTSLTKAPELPATTLANQCYYGMFSGCISLTKAPELPATILANECYSFMFQNCTSLVKAPELPATTLVNMCYQGMFMYCESLKEAPELQATTLIDNCYSSMFYGCTSLTKAPELPATTLATYCYFNMFYRCTSLITAPTLPATTLATGCYVYMFRECTSLTKAPELPATTLASFCYYEMFNGCTSLITAPTLPATTLATDCYAGMFRECTSLTYIKALFTTTPGNTYTQDWVLNVAPKGRFIKSKLATWELIGNTGVPNGWEIGEPVYEKLIGDDKNNLYIEKEGSVYPINHPDLSTQPSLLPQRFGVFPMYEILCPYSEEENDFDTSLIPNDAVIIEGSVFGNGYCEGLNSYWVTPTQCDLYWRYDQSGNKYLVNEFGNLVYLNDGNSKYIIYEDSFIEESHVSELPTFNQIIQWGSIILLIGDPRNYAENSYIYELLRSDIGYGLIISAENNKTNIHTDNNYIIRNNQNEEIIDYVTINKLYITNIINDFTPEYALVRYYSNKLNKYGYSK